MPEKRSRSALVGNTPPELVGIMRVVPRKKDADFIYSLEVKRDYENLVDYECPAKLEKKTLQRIQEYQPSKPLQVLECRDFARVDFPDQPGRHSLFSGDQSSGRT